MDYKTLEYKMRGGIGLELLPNVVLWGKERKKPIMIQILGENKMIEFDSFEDAGLFVLPNGQKVGDILEKVSDKDFMIHLT